MMLRSLTDKQMRKDWYFNGGMPTLRSFGVRETSEVPYHFMEFLGSLEYFHETGDYIIVHAGLNFDIPDPLADREGMLWIRNTFVLPEKIGNRTMIHGHTPVSAAEIRQAVESNSKDIDLDGGCVYTGIEGLGNLCALELNSLRLEVQPNVDFL
jgi:serine/threonine protein phosphatase 1